MIDDPVVLEVRRIRQEHAAKFGYDLEAIFADLKQSEEDRDRQQSPLLAPPEEPLHQTPAALVRGRRR